MMRTYSGHSSAEASNELYRMNLAKGQTGLSIAFDLPTQTGYDPDSAMSKGEVGKVGVPVAHLGHMHTLLDQIPPDKMNTSMTINATAAWLLALYVANAEEQGIPSSELRGTTQNDIVKEYLSRGTYIFPPVPSRRLIVDMVAWCAQHAPLWNPMNVCSYHLQEAGATPEQEIAYSMATAIGVLDAVRNSGQVSPEQFTQVFGSISFFVNAGIRFVEEICKLRAMAEMWEIVYRYMKMSSSDAISLRLPPPPDVFTDHSFPTPPGGGGSGIDDDPSRGADVDDDDPRAHAMSVYDFLTWLQETLATAMLPGADRSA